MKLLRSQSNTLLKILADDGWAIEDFSLSQKNIQEDLKALAQNQDVLKVVYLPRPEFHFTSIQADQFDMEATLAPGEKDYEDNVALSGFTELVHNYRRWLSFLRRELTEPDLWAAMSEDWTGGSWQMDTTQLSQEDREKVQSTVDAIEAVLKRFETQDDRIGKLEKQLAELLSKSQSETKRDVWTYFKFNVVPHLINLALNPEVVKMIMGAIHGSSPALPFHSPLLPPMA